MLQSTEELQAVSTKANDNVNLVHHSNSESFIVITAVNKFYKIVYRSVRLKEHCLNNTKLLYNQKKIMPTDAKYMYSQKGRKQTNCLNKQPQAE